MTTRVLEPREIFERRAQVPRLTGAAGQIIVATELPKNPGAGSKTEAAEPRSPAPKTFQATVTL